jgi:hypothetical protein
MGFPRSHTVNPQVSCVYHCVSRCVRRENLIADAVRAAWIEGRLEFLASLFAVDVLEYAIMSNHLHLLLRLRPELAACWTPEEVAMRWLTLRQACPLANSVDTPRPTSAEIRDAVADEAAIDEWRSRLGGLSWFHKELKEPCARIWNAEDEKTGHFWEGRYSSKVALDDVAVVAQALYVLLNPVRAGMESGVGRSRRTSIGARMRRIVREIRAGKHGGVVAAFTRQIGHGVWTPVFPCDPGSVAELSDEEYADRVARTRQRNEVRRGMRKKAETIARLATDAPVDELLVALHDDHDELMLDEVTAGDGSAATGVSAPRPTSVSHARLPCHRLRQRQSSLPSADVRTSHLSFVTAMQNPFRADRVAAGSTAAVHGMTLAALLTVADRHGRHARPDKPGVIADHEPKAFERFLAMAKKPWTGDDPDLALEEPAVALAPQEIAGRSPDPDAESLARLVTAGRTLRWSERVRTLVGEVIGVLTSHMGMLASAERASRAGRASAWSDSGSPGERSTVQPTGGTRVRWFGSASGSGSLLASEAERRGAERVVAERPLLVR